MSLADEVQSVRQRVSERLAELEPLAREYKELTRLARELGIGVSENASAGERPSARGPKRRPGPSRARGGRSEADGKGAKAADTQAARRAHRPTPTPASSDEQQLRTRVLEAVLSAPGVTVGEMAKLMHVPATVLYRPVRELTSEGALVKRGRALFPLEG